MRAICEGANWALTDTEAEAAAEADAEADAEARRRVANKRLPVASRVATGGGGWRMDCRLDVRVPAPGMETTHATMRACAAASLQRLAPAIMMLL